MLTCRYVNFHGFPRPQLANTRARSTLTASRYRATCSRTCWTCAGHLEAAVQYESPRTRSTTRCTGRSFGSGLQSGSGASTAVDDRGYIDRLRSSLACFHERDVYGGSYVIPACTLSGRTWPPTKGGAKERLEDISLSVTTSSSKCRSKVMETAKSSCATKPSCKVRVESRLLRC